MLLLHSKKINMSFVKSVFDFMEDFILGTQIMLSPKVGWNCKINLKY